MCLSVSRIAATASPTFGVPNGGSFGAQTLAATTHRTRSPIEITKRDHRLGSSNEADLGTEAEVRMFLRMPAGRNLAQLHANLEHDYRCNYTKLHEIVGFATKWPPPAAPRFGRREADG